MQFISILLKTLLQKINLIFFFYFFQQDCPNGRLTPAKFVDMYKMFFPSGNAEEFCDHVFRTFDMDKNGYIDFKVRLELQFQHLLHMRNLFIGYNVTC